MPDGASLLEARNISKQYGGRQIIKDICIRLEKGELISLLGLSGSGKTTLFHVLSGLTVPEEGNVFLEGRDITGMPGSVSYMLQKDLLLAHKKVIDNVSLPLVLRGAKKKDARAAADPLFSQFGLDGTQYLYPSQLSGGMRQRAALLRTYLSSLKDDACAMKSSAAQTQATLRDNASSAGVGKAPPVQKSGSSSGGVALLDEPFSALDTITKSQIHTWYLDVMQKISLSTIFITHDIDEAILLSDRIYIMTGAPGVVTNEIRILPPRPQRREFNLTSEFLDYKRQIIHILGQDV